MKKLMTLVAALGLAGTGFAAMNDALLAFSTPGTDTYADGTTVADGECYALVWSRDGVFEGFKADCTPVDEADKVVLIAPVAKGGRCPTIVYQIPAATADALKDGVYGVYLLDTRVAVVKNADGTTTTTLAEFKAGRPVMVNAQTAVGESTTAMASRDMSAMAVAATAVGGASVTKVSNVDAPKITGIKIDAAQIQVTVTGLSPVVSYGVLAGDTPRVFDERVTAEVTTKENEDGTIDGTFTFPQPKGRFFKVLGAHKFVPTNSAE